MKQKGIIKLTWKKPFKVARRSIRFYSIERRQISQAQGVSTGQWQQTGSAIDDKIILNNEPMGVRLEYRVRAVNKAGQSQPSNTVEVIL